LSQINRVINLVFMSMRSIALFAHLVGMLTLFAGLAIEWLCVERLHAPDEPEPPMFIVRILERLPHISGIAVASILLSGIPLAARIGVFRAAFVGVSFVAMVLMAALGGIALRPLLRAVKEGRGTGAALVTELRQLASRPFLRGSLRIRVCIALAIVYLMIAKPDLFECIVILATALLIAVVGNIARGRGTATTLSPQDAAKHPGTHHRWVAIVLTTLPLVYVVVRLSFRPRTFRIRNERFGRCTPVFLIKRLPWLFTQLLNPRDSAEA
jgi:hypothetical protein